MSKIKQLHISYKDSALIKSLGDDFLAENGLVDLRVQPFQATYQQHEEMEQYDLEVNRIFGPKILLDSGYQHGSVLDPARVNNWLAAVDHFGVNAEYHSDFFAEVESILINIVTYGYLEEGSDPNTANRMFNGRVLTREEFYAEFFRLIVRYVPIKGVEEPEHYNYNGTKMQF